MQTTLHFSFPIFESSDKPSWLADWNSTVTKIDNKLYEVSVGNCGEQILHDLEEAIEEMNEVVGRVDTLNTQVTTLTGDVETLQSVVNGISDTIAIINDAIDNLDGKIDDVDSTLSTLTTTVSNLQTVVQNLVDNPYELPIASANTLGGIKVGTNLSIDANGVLSASGGGGSSDDAVKVLTENDFPSEIVIETQYGHQQGRLTLPACPYVEGEATPQEILDYAENPVFWFNPTISNLYVGIYIEGITQQVGGFHADQFLRPYVSIVPIYNQQTQEETRYWSVSYGVAVNVTSTVNDLTYSKFRVFPPGATIPAISIPAYHGAGPNSPQGFWTTDDCAIMLPDNTTVQVEKGKLYLCVYNQTTYKADIVPVYSGGGSSYTLPPATANTLGGVMVGTGLSVDANGVLSATGGSGEIIQFGDNSLSIYETYNGNLNLKRKIYRVFSGAGLITASLVTDTDYVKEINLQNSISLDYPTVVEKISPVVQSIYTSNIFRFTKFDDTNTNITLTGYLPVFDVKDIKTTFSNGSTLSKFKLTGKIKYQDLVDYFTTLLSDRGYNINDYKAVSLTFKPIVEVWIYTNN